jgi:hypothetical protein
VAANQLTGRDGKLLTDRKKLGSARSRKTAGVVSQGLVNNKYIDDRPVPYRKPPPENAQKKGGDESPIEETKDAWAFAQRKGQPTPT